MSDTSNSSNVGGRGRRIGSNADGDSGDSGNSSSNNAVLHHHDNSSSNNNDSNTTTPEQGELPVVRFDQDRSDVTATTTTAVVRRASKRLAAAAVAATVSELEEESSDEEDYEPTQLAAETTTKINSRVGGNKRKTRTTAPPPKRRSTRRRKTTSNNTSGDRPQQQQQQEPLQQLVEQLQEQQNVLDRIQQPLQQPAEQQQQLFSALLIQFHEFTLQRDAAAGSGGDRRMDVYSDDCFHMMKKIYDTKKDPARRREIWTNSGVRDLPHETFEAFVRKLFEYTFDDSEKCPFTGKQIIRGTKNGRPMVRRVELIAILLQAAGASVNKKDSSILVYGKSKATRKPVVWYLNNETNLRVSAGRYLKMLYDFAYEISGGGKKAQLPQELQPPISAELLRLPMPLYRGVTADDETTDTDTTEEVEEEEPAAIDDTEDDDSAVEEPATDNTEEDDESVEEEPATDNTEDDDESVEEPATDNTEDGDESVEEPATDTDEVVEEPAEDDDSVVEEPEIENEDDDSAVEEPLFDTAEDDDSVEEEPALANLELTRSSDDDDLESSDLDDDHDAFLQPDYGDDDGLSPPPNDDDDDGFVPLDYDDDEVFDTDDNKTTTAASDTLVPPPPPTSPTETSVSATDTEDDSLEEEPAFINLNSRRDITDIFAAKPAARKKRAPSPQSPGSDASPEKTDPRVPLRRNLINLKDRVDITDILAKKPAARGSLQMPAEDPLRMSKAAETEYEKNYNVLPQDAGVRIEDLHQLFLRPGVTINSHKNGLARRPSKDNSKPVAIIETDDESVAEEPTGHLVNRKDRVDITPAPARTKRDRSQFTKAAQQMYEKGDNVLPKRAAVRADVMAAKQPKTPRLNAAVLPERPGVRADVTIDKELPERTAVRTDIMAVKQTTTPPANIFVLPERPGVRADVMANKKLTKPSTNENTISPSYSIGSSPQAGRPSQPSTPARNTPRSAIDRTDSSSSLSFDGSKDDDSAASADLRDDGGSMNDDEDIIETGSASSASLNGSSLVFPDSASLDALQNLDLRLDQQKLDTFGRLLDHHLSKNNTDCFTFLGSVQHPNTATRDNRPPLVLRRHAAKVLAVLTSEDGHRVVAEFDLSHRKVTILDGKLSHEVGYWSSQLQIILRSIDPSSAHDDVKTKDRGSMCIGSWEVTVEVYIFQPETNYCDDGLIAARYLMDKCDCCLIFSLPRCKTHPLDFCSPQDVDIRGTPTFCQVIKDPAELRNGFIQWFKALVALYKDELSN